MWRQKPISKTWPHLNQLPWVECWWDGIARKGDKEGHSCFSQTMIQPYAAGPLDAETTLNFFMANSLSAGTGASTALIADNKQDSLPLAVDGVTSSAGRSPQIQLNKRFLLNTTAIRGLIFRYMYNVYIVRQIYQLDAHFSWSSLVSHSDVCCASGKINRKVAWKIKARKY